MTQSADSRDKTIRDERRHNGAATSTAHPGAPDQLRRRRRHPRRKAFDALILSVILGLIAYAFYRYYEDILEILYSRTAMVVLVLLVVEFLILKSFDRTRLYRIENNRLVRRRMADLQALREAEAAIAALLHEPPVPPTEVKRIRQLKGSMVDESDDEEEAPKTPIATTAPGVEGEPQLTEPTPAPTPSSSDSPAPATATATEATAPTAPPEATVEQARRVLRHIRKRAY